MTLLNTDWLPSSGAVLKREATINAPEINQEHIDTGVVLVYVQNVFLGLIPNSIVPLPMDDDEIQFLVRGIDVGEVILKVRRLNLASFTANFVALPFRYIIIPGNIPAKDGSHPDFKKMTYYEVMDYFKISY